MRKYNLYVKYVGKMKVEQPSSTLHHTMYRSQPITQYIYIYICMILDCFLHYLLISNGGVMIYTTLYLIGTIAQVSRILGRLYRNYSTGI